MTYVKDRRSATGRIAPPVEESALPTAPAASYRSLSHRHPIRGPDGRTRWGREARPQPTPPGSGASRTAARAVQSIAGAMWEKFRMLAEGAKLATERLWK